jgi:hypothetical protein
LEDALLEHGGAVGVRNRQSQNHRDIFQTPWSLITLQEAPCQSANDERIFIPFGQFP